MGRLNEILHLAQQRARDKSLAYEGALTPGEAWEVLEHAPGARLIDIRSRAELDWVGRIRNAIEIEWQTYPVKQFNPNFLVELKQAVDRESLLLFICRSGGRSNSAATAAAAAGFLGCYNVLEGFEGDKNAQGHRASVGGWKFAGLPWVQGCESGER